MKNYDIQIESIEKYILKSITCDKCKTTYTDIFDIQEFHHINFEGGYDSIFGDGNEIEVDICDKCFYEMIKDFYRIKKGNINE